VPPRRPGCKTTSPPCARRISCPRPLAMSSIKRSLTIFPGNFNGVRGRLGVERHYCERARCCRISRFAGSRSAARPSRSGRRLPVSAAAIRIPSRPPGSMSDVSLRPTAGDAMPSCEKPTWPIAGADALHDLGVCRLPALRGLGANQGKGHATLTDQVDRDTGQRRSAVKAGMPSRLASARQ
jgi:hypothetical protein